ncbi:hypothetical protein G4B88_024080 [Cannabis sativa]|uniref:Rx N-terminal domain-containing protein n=1 Tax=Cannabis sativa TaxID=3483 RepID=A0A7J6DR83_CANSA|nr:hypothetical protein G4B88_024080 [Cannabis sativa]
MAEGVLFDLAASLIEMLGSAAFEEARLLCGVKDEFQKLVGTIEVIKGVLLDAEEKMAVDNQVKAWLKQLGDVFIFADDLSSGVHELSNLINNLNGSLTIEGLWRTTNYSASKTTSKRVICEGKHNLHSLTLQCNILEDNEMAIERLQPPSNLKVLHMSHFEGVRLGGWDSSLNNLVKLELNLCGQCQYLPKLDQLRYLEELRIKWVGAEYMCSSGEDDDFDANLFFPSLVTLQIEDCYNLKWWWWKKEVDGNNIRSFPRLSNLSIYHCSHLTSMPLFPSIENVRLYKTSSMALKDTFKMMRGSKAHNTHPNISLLRFRLDKRNGGDIGQKQCHLAELQKDDQIEKDGDIRS